MQSSEQERSEAQQSPGVKRRQAYLWPLVRRNALKLAAFAVVAISVGFFLGYLFMDGVLTLPELTALGLLGLSTLVFVFVLWVWGQFKAFPDVFSGRIERAEERVEKEPDKARPAWDLARVTLEAYFNRNLNQVTWIFWLSLFVMLAGFMIIIWGITQAVQNPDSDTAAIVTGFAGVITELIGATFLFVYRSTMQQASKYIETLERINSVGMAMQILDTMPRTKTEYPKDAMKAEVVRQLMQQAHRGKRDEESPE